MKDQVQFIPMTNDKVARRCSGFIRKSSFDICVDVAANRDRGISVPLNKTQAIKMINDCKVDHCCITMIIWHASGLISFMSCETSTWGRELDDTFINDDLAGMVGI